MVRCKRFSLEIKAHILDRIHVHVVTLKCELSCQEGNISLRMKLFTNVDFLQDTVDNSCIHTETFLEMQQERFVPFVFVNGHIHLWFVPLIQVSTFVS